MLRRRIASGAAWKGVQVAEEEGFEPSVQFPIRHISNVLVSATHPLLREGFSDLLDGL